MDDSIEDILRREIAGLRADLTAERARIRRELLQELGWLDATAVDLRAILDRICPEEG